jgi:putative peptide zinc metalloprotease protein
MDPPPNRAAGLELLGPVTGSGYRRPPSLVRRADGQTLQLTPLAYSTLDAIDGRRTHEELASHVGREIARDVTADDIRYLIEQKLRPLGVLRQPDGSEPTVARRDPLLALRLRKVITNPEVTGRITAPFAKLFLPQIVVPMVIAFVASTLWLMFVKGLAAPTHEALYEPGRLLLVFGLMMLSAGFHEFGHAAAATYGGVKPGAMGMGIYLVWPVFYTDVTNAYRLPRRARLRVDLGGLYFNAIFAVAIVGVWAVTRWDSLLLLVPIQIAHMLHQLLPFVRFDGYHILADLTGVPDLFAHIKPTLLHLLPTRWGKRDRKVLRPLASSVVTVWVLTVVPMLGVVFLAMVTLFPRLAATAWDSIAARWEILQTNWANGDASQVAVLLLSIATIALPVLGVTYLIVRVVRRSSRRVWRATEGRPALRTMAVVAGLAILALLAWTWWPNGQYRPIEASERGTVADLATFATPPQAGTLIDTSSRRAIPPGSSPRLAFVLTPTDAPSAEPIVTILPPSVDPGDTDTWVFPFDPPAAPGEGDNQALAINTVDGSTVYDVSIAVVWVTEGDVDNVNEAWAVASCSNCQTVAIAYQAIFVLDQTATVVPQNIAVAANYDCVRCQTTALAGQLVVTLTDPPSDEAMAQLAALTAELEALEDTITEMTLEEVYAELDRIETAIVHVLIEDGALDLSEVGLIEVTSTDLPSPSPEVVTVGDPAATEPTATDTTTTEDTTTTSDAGEPAPSESPAPSPEESPSPSPEESPSPAESPSPSPAAGP